MGSQNTPRSAAFVATYLSLLIGAAFAADITAAAGPLRPARINDRFANESVAEASFAPNGGAFAYVRKRSELSVPPRLQSDFEVEQRGDIWVQESVEGLTRNLTEGASDDSGAWSPVWSQDGQKLAFLSTRGGSIRLWVWDRGAPRVRVVAATPVRIPTGQEAFRWADDQTLVCLSPPQGEPSPSANTYFAQAARRPTEAWARAARGEATGRVVSSTDYYLEPARLMRIDVDSGGAALIAEAFLETFSRSTDWWMSPDGTTFVVRPRQILHYSGPIQTRMCSPVELEFRHPDGTLLPIAGLPKGIHSKSARWNPVTNEFVFFAQGEAPVHPALLFGAAAAEVMPDRKDIALENSARLYRLDTHGALSEVPTGEIELGQLGSPEFEFTTKGDLLIRAPRRRYGFTVTPPTSRGPAWGFSQTAAEPIAPVQMEQWLIAPNAAPVNISESEYRKLRWISPQAEIRQKFKPSAVVEPDATLLAVSPQGDEAVYTKDDGNRAPTKMWRVARGKTGVIATFNQYRAGVERAGQESIREIEFTSMNGETLLMRLRLPIDFQAGRRYPVLVDQYPGTVEEPLSIRSRDAFARGLPEIPALTGFVHATVSVPRALPGMGRERNEIGAEEGEMIFMPANAVMPAVQKLIDMGIADPERLAVEGASNGGWGALALAVTTTRFKAVIADCPVNWGSVFNRYRGMNRAFWDRYIDSPSHGVLVSNPNGYIPTDLPWWRDGRPERNNLLRYADRVQTPVMLCHGDMDDHPMDTSQDFFNALVSMRKPAIFVRYWGTGHDFSATPANHHDYWQRKLAWIDRWCDIARDENGDMIWDGDHVTSRNGVPPLEPADYLKFPLFGPGGEEGNKQWYEQQAKKGAAARGTRN